MTTTDHPVSRPPATGSYRIDPDRSRVRFATHAIFGLLPVRGTVRIAHGVLEVTDPPERSSVEVVLRAETFDSANGDRDQHVCSADFLDTERYPEFHFTGDRWGNAAGDPVLAGRLTVRGVTRPVQVRVVALARQEGELRVRATARVDRFAFGIRRSRGMAGRYLRLTIEVTATA